MRRRRRRGARTRLGCHARLVLVQDFRQHPVPVIFPAGARGTFNAQMAHEKARKLGRVFDLVVFDGRKLLRNGWILLHISHVAALSATPLSESRPGPEVLRPVVTDGLPLSRRTVRDRYPLTFHLAVKG